MIGLFRILLAIYVIFQHTGPIFGIIVGNGGVAIYVFYILAGFFAALSLNTKYDNYNKYIISRIMRIPNILL